ncbi:MAG: hypothetical protein ABIS50_23375 [Luteolibacter sp.]|uniref:hypothetical protein n=1 Tax=Luteolibacter sp. TaxID=1962973 RepID=UPI003265CC45
MSAAPSEPEKYSIDEMMERLKNNISGNLEEDGELVVRADGTQAIRVKKRKRRSDQPHKTERSRTRRSRIFQVSAAMILIILAGLGIAAAVIYANSPPFREGLVRKIVQSTGADTELKMFRMNPQSANATNLALKWPEGNVLSSLSLRGVNAEIFPSSFLGKSMNGEEITVVEGALALHVPQPGQPLRVEPASEDELPIQFKRYRIPKFSLTLGDPSSPVMGLLKSEASFYPTSLNGRPQFNLSQGELWIKGWPMLRLDRSFIEFRDKEVDIVSLRILDGSDSRGTFEISGTVLPYSPDRLSTLSVELKDFQLSGITGPHLGKLFSGRIDTLPTTKSNYLTFYPSQNPTPKLAIAFRCSLTSTIEVSGFPCLFMLSQALEDEWFQRPSFEGDTVGGTLQYEADATKLQDLNLESKGRMALRGHISVAANQALSGNLEVGVADSMVAASKTSRMKTLFGPSKEGFRWITLKIGGTASNPTDNFKELFLAPEATPSAESNDPDHKGSTFDELTKPR